MEETITTLDSIELWPVPVGIPLYVTIDEAAELTGMPRDLMRQWANNQLDPMPQIQRGKKKLLRTSALPEYIKKHEYA